jgi:predicted DNA-binding transcriptional regulator YafY
MDGDVAAQAPGSAVLPDGFDPDDALPDVPWRIGEGAPVTVALRVDGALAGLVLDEVGESALERRHDDGSVVLHLEVTNIAALRSWLFELGDHAEVLGPAEVRAAVVSWLEAMAAVSATPGSPS